jgi:hypothetical protein
MPILTHVFGYFPRATGLGEDIPAGMALQWAVAGLPDCVPKLRPVTRIAAARNAWAFCEIGSQSAAISFADDKFALTAGTRDCSRSIRASVARYECVEPSTVDCKHWSLWILFRREQERVVAIGARRCAGRLSETPVPSFFVESQAVSVCHVPVDENRDILRFWHNPCSSTGLSGAGRAALRDEGGRCQTAFTTTNWVAKGPKRPLLWTPRLAAGAEYSPKWFNRTGVECKSRAF